MILEMRVKKSCKVMASDFKFLEMSVIYSKDTG